MFRYKKGGISEAIPLLLITFFLLAGFGFLGAKVTTQNQKVKLLADTTNEDIAATDILLWFINKPVQHEHALAIADLVLYSVSQDSYVDFGREATSFFNKEFTINGDFKRTWSVRIQNDKNTLYEVDGKKYATAGTKKRIARVLIPHSEGTLTISLLKGEQLR